MRILIDSRLYGPKHTGIGRYTQNLISSISKTEFAQKNQITLLVNHKDLQNIKLKYKNIFNYLPTKISHYSWQEQFILPITLYSHNFNLVHFTHFNKPILYLKTSVLTIHDLIKHFYYGSNTTTKMGLFYWPKYLAYRIITNLNIKANFIIVPSNYWRDFILTNYNLSDNKIITTYEAIDPIFSKPQKIFKPKKYLVYTGNLYPHKNVTVLLHALKKLPNLKLYILTKPGVFLSRTQKEISKLRLAGRIKIILSPTDSFLKHIYSQALALVHPSLMEGFGLTGLEAMASNCPVISSNSSCLPEIYQNKVLYFQPQDITTLIQQINLLQNKPQLRLKLIKNGQQYLKRFSWEKAAKETLNFYAQILSTNQS